MRYKMDKATADKLLILAVIILIGLGITITILLTSKGSKCMSNPQDYLIEELVKANHANVTCTCFTDDFTKPSFIFGSFKNGSSMYEGNG